MKRIVFLFPILIFALSAMAQQKDSLSLTSLRNNPRLEERFKARLVELAMKYPTQDEFKARQEINKYEVRVAKAAWLNHFLAQGNLNEYSIKGGDQNVFFPRYNFSVTLPLGNLISVPNQVKIAKTNRKVSDALRRTDSIELKIRVLKMYETYIANEQFMELHIPIMNDALTNFALVESKFENGELSVDAYNAAFKNFNAEKVTAITLKRELMQSKIDLETTVGATLEEVLLQSSY